MEGSIYPRDPDISRFISPGAPFLPLSYVRSVCVRAWLSVCLSVLCVCVCSCVRVAVYACGWAWAWAYTYSRARTNRRDFSLRRRRKSPIAVRISVAISSSLPGSQMMTLGRYFGCDDDAWEACCLWRRQTCGCRDVCMRRGTIRVPGAAFPHRRTLCRHALHMQTPGVRQLVHFRVQRLLIMCGRARYCHAHHAHCGA